MSEIRTTSPSRVRARAFGRERSSSPFSPLECSRIPSRTSNGEVQALTVVLENLNNPHRLPVMIEPSSDEFVQRRFSGVTEWRVSQVVPEPDRFG